VHADGECVGGKRGACGRELSVEHRLQKSGLLVNYDGNSESGRRQTSESAHGPGIPAILCKQGYSKMHEVRAHCIRRVDS